jgi:hypothetical protein
MTEQQLENIRNELIAAESLCKMSAVLSPLSEDDLQEVYEDILDEYGEELAFGALERSEWLCGVFIINANQPSICQLRAVLDVIRSKFEKRKTMLAVDLAAKLPN